MEKLYSIENLLTHTASAPMDGHKIKLRNGHLWIDGPLFDEVIGEGRQIYAVYYPNLKSILIAPDTDQTFRQAHEVIMLFVKIKNANMDRSISIQEFMADHDIDDHDRDLTYLAIPGTPLMKINL